MDSFAPNANAFRFYDDDAGEAASTPLANQDTNVTVNVSSGNVALQLRYRVQNGTAVAGAATDDYALQYSINGGGFTTVNGATTGVITSTSGLTNDGATTNRGTNGIADGTGSFVAGEQCTDGLLDNHTLTASNFTEHVWGITLVAADLANSDAITFRVALNGGAPGMTNSVTPTITAQKAASLSLTADQGSYALTGQTATFSHGRPILAAQGTYALTGQTATFSINRTLVAEQGSFVLTGQAAHLQPSNAEGPFIVEESDDTFITEAGDQLVTEGFVASQNLSIDAAQGIYALTGQAVTLPIGQVIGADQGSYTLSGQPVSFSIDRPILAQQGSYTLAGQTAALIKGKVVGAEQGSYALMGNAAFFPIASTILAEQGSYTLSGQAVSFSIGSIVAADQGTYTLTGNVVSFSIGSTIGAEQGTYTLTGQDAILTTGEGPIVIDAAQGTYTLSGQAVTFPIASIVGAEQGTYSLTGQPLALSLGTTLLAAQGSYALAGQTATFTLGISIGAEQGTYTLAGQSVLFAQGTVLVAGQGSYNLTGQNVSFALGISGETDVYIHTIPANTLANNGETIEFDAAGTFVGNGNSKRIRVIFGSAIIFDSSSMAIDVASSWRLTGVVVRTSATTQKCAATLVTSHASYPANTLYSTAGEDVTAGIEAKLGLTGGAADDVVAEYYKERWVSA